MPHIRLKEVQGVCQKRGQNLRQAGMDKCRETGAAHRDKGLIGGYVRMFRILVGELCHDRKGVERDREGPRKGSESEEKGRGERQDQRRKRPEHLDQETQQTPCPGRKMQGHGAKGETISARADPVTVPVTDIWTV